MSKTGSDLRYIYIYIYIKRSSIDYEAIELLLKVLKESFQGKEAAHDERKQDRHQNKQSKSMLGIKTHPQL